MREDGWEEVKAPGELGSLGLEADWQGCRLVARARRLDPTAATGRSEVIRAACEDSSRLVPVDVGAGTVTIYSSRLWHRGGANQGKRERVFAFLTLAEASSAAPPGLIHTMTRDDVGAWIVGAEGLVQRE